MNYYKDNEGGYYCITNLDIFFDNNKDIYLRPATYKEYQDARFKEVNK